MVTSLVKPINIEDACCFTVFRLVLYRGECGAIIYLNHNGYCIHSAIQNILTTTQSFCKVLIFLGGI